jgi:hypothetical protein
LSIFFDPIAEVILLRDHPFRSELHVFTECDVFNGNWTSIKLALFTQGIEGGALSFSLSGSRGIAFIKKVILSQVVCAK